MLSEEKLSRINYLARKAREEGLTDEEKEEQRLLREEYLKNFRESFKRQLESIKVIKKD